MIIEFKAAKADELPRKLFDEGVRPFEVINKELISAMNMGGDRFKQGKIYVPNVIMEAKAMHAEINIVKLLLK